MMTKRRQYTHIVRRRTARVDSNGRGIPVPTVDLRPERLALRRFSWEMAEEEART